MTSIAVQSAVGASSSKAVTELTYNFSSIINTGKFQYGLNREGIFLLNNGDTDDGELYSRSFTLATTDLDVVNMKRARKLLIGIDTRKEFTVSITFDNNNWRHYTRVPEKLGLQTLEISIGRGRLTQGGSGRYVTIKVTSMYRFRVDHILGNFFVRPRGIKGY